MVRAPYLRGSPPPDRERVREREPPPASDGGDGPTLTGREREVLSLIVAGRENNEIAASS